MRSFLFTLLALVLSGCSSDGSVLRVDLRTDYVPEVELAEVDVLLSGPMAADAVVVHEVGTDDYVRGVRLGAYDELPSGDYELRVRLFGPDGARLAQRQVRVRVEGPTTVTVVATRSCREGDCPTTDPEATECIGGRCEPPSCTPETPGSCRAEGCTDDADCPTPASACAQAVCASGACFDAPVDGRCGAGEVCVPESGCRPRVMGEDGGAGDAGTVDAGLPADGGPGDGGPPDAGAVDAGPCPPGSEGATCAPSDTGSWSGCGYSSACDESASRSRSVTDYTCRSGVCEASSRTETDGCSRNTDGDSCMDGVFCYDFFCGADGLITRNCEEDSCSSGSCSTRSYQEKYGPCGG